MRHSAIILFFFVTLFGISTRLTAQFLEDVPDMKGKIVYGGNLGGGMTGNFLSFSIAPQVGYRIVSPWEVGVRGIYDLVCDFQQIHGNSYSHYFGIAPYTNYQVYKGLFVHVEDELMYQFSRYNHATVNSNWFKSVFVGGGLRQYGKSGSHMYVMLLYNLSWGNLSSGHMQSPYASPIAFRAGFCF